MEWFWLGLNPETMELKFNDFEAEEVGLEPTSRFLGDTGLANPGLTN